MNFQGLSLRRHTESVVWSIGEKAEEVVETDVGIGLMVNGPYQGTRARFENNEALVVSFKYEFLPEIRRVCNCLYHPTQDCEIRVQMLKETRTSLRM